MRKASDCDDIQTLPLPPRRADVCLVGYLGFCGQAGGAYQQRCSGRSAQDWAVKAGRCHVGKDALLQLEGVEVGHVG